MSHHFHGPGYVYFIRLRPKWACTYKIGFSKNIDKRLKTFGDVKLLASFYSEDGLKDENDIQNKFYKHSHRNIFNKITEAFFITKKTKNMDVLPKTISYFCWSNSEEWMYLKNKKVIDVIEEFNRYRLLCKQP